MVLSLCGREAWQGLEGNASPFSHFASLCHTSSGTKDQCFPAQFPDLLLSDSKRGWLKEHLSSRCSPHWHARCGQGPGLGGWRLLGSDCHTSSPQEGATDLPTRDARWGLSHPESGQDVLWAMGRDGPEPGNSGKSGGMLTAGTINPERLSVGVGI